MPLPKIPSIDVFSFWLGFAAAAVIGLVLFWFRGPLGKVADALRARWHRLRESLVVGPERLLRDEVISQTRASHVAGALFPLDRILVAPRLLVPRPPLDPTAPATDEDMTSVIPLLPEWPEMAGLYRLPTLSVEEGFKGEANIVVLGPPGSGKTTLLAHLALRAAQGDETLFPEAPTPVWVHAGDLNLANAASEDAAQPLIAAVQMRVPALLAQQLARHLPARLRGGHGLILLDGVDELPPKQVTEVANWLAAFLKAYGGNRVIAAAGLWGYGPLLRRGFAPMTIAPWGPEDFRQLALNWERLLLEARAHNQFIGPGRVEPAVLTGWVTTNNQGRSVFEVTLKIWAALTGDARGNGPAAWLEAYRLRLGLSAKPTETAALGKAAAAMLSNVEFLGLARPELAKICSAALVGPDGRAEVDGDTFLDRLVKQRLLVRRAQDRLCFRYPLMVAYCGAFAVAANAEIVPPAVDGGWVWALYFCAGLGDLAPVVARLLQQPPDLLFSDLLACARWLRDTASATPWRTEVFRRLSRLLIEKSLPESLRLRALAGLVAANDQSVVSLFRQVVASPDPFTRRLAALGLGASGEPSMVPFLEPLLADEYLDVRWAATLALAAIGSEPAVTALAAGMLQGDDALRQACAQALARLPEAGHPLLKEAVAHDQLAVRHAAVYGLFETRTDWARKILEDAQIHEKEWLVRNATVELVSQWTTPPDRSPRARVAPDKLGWLVAWAASKGTGLPPGKAALEVVSRALREGEEPFRCAAAEVLAQQADPNLVRDLYGALRESPPLVRDAAFRALAEVGAASGQRLLSSMA
jgi:HEAT repeat protein